MCQEKKSVAEGDLTVTSEDLSEDITALRDLHRDCASSVQLSLASTSKNDAAVRLVQRLARKQSSPALAQLASRMASSIRLSGGGADIFGKVKGPINDMVDKLEAEADIDATEKTFCDKEEHRTAIARAKVRLPDSRRLRLRELRAECSQLQGSDAGGWILFC